MSIMVMFGIGSLAMFALLVGLFMTALLAGAGDAGDAEQADDEEVDRSSHAHGVHLG
ncbi:hypothetical protein HNR23_001472 [Nocardiopsis mwathae]|uniref:Uncharacterized protein n=1 Tax=Nocardiopsis mwathae TaxID=1472723 RepID=A0A7W9YG07_9ACTN|nr:hypothetical protein [Nocardiopsis mwathae]MBB6171412.1 hypothetical protein [Nocardiopsis mwathae]